MGAPLVTRVNQFPTSNFQLPTANIEHGVGHSLCLRMNTSKWSLGPRPYDLRVRLLDFACLIVRVVEYLHTRGRIASALSVSCSKQGRRPGLTVFASSS